MRAVPPVKWLSEKLPWDECNDKDFVYKVADFYSKFRFKNIEAAVGDFVLVSNADSADPDTEEGCDVAQISKLYESHDLDLLDRHRAQVVWYSKPCDLPKKIKYPDSGNVMANEVVEDHRPFGKDVSIETFFKKCIVILSPLSITDKSDLQNDNRKIPTFICRYRLTQVSTKKFEIEPVLENERLQYKLQQQLLLTPKTPKSNRNAPRTPTARKNLHDQLMSTPLTPSAKLGNQLSHLTLDGSNSKPPKWRVTASESTKLVLNRTPVKKLRKLEADSDESFKSGSATDSDDDFVSGSVKATRRSVVPRQKATPSTPSRQKATPSTPSRTKKATQASTPKTKLLTPSMRDRRTPIVHKTGDEVMHELECQLPGREEQLSEITSFITSKLIDGSSGCLYISGVPGTGKTATVRVALDKLKEAAEIGDLSEFSVVEINGMQMVEPRQAYVHIYRQLTGKTIAPAQACDLLTDRFTKPAPRRQSTVLLVDELDALCTRRQEVIYNVVEWTSHKSARLIVVAIANTMDLPERALSAKVCSRLGHARMQFPPYTHTQLQNIISLKLNCATFLTSDAVQLAARKVSAVSGDARRAIALCTRALELVKQGNMGEGSLGALRAVESALREMASGVSVRAIRCCSDAEKRLLKAAAAEVEATGIEEINGIKVADRACLWSSLGGHGIAGGGAKALWRRLGEMRLVAVGSWPRVMLYVSPSDVHYATQDL